MSKKYYKTILKQYRSEQPKKSKEDKVKRLNEYIRRYQESPVYFDDDAPIFDEMHEDIK